MIENFDTILVICMQISLYMTISVPAITGQAN